jgi:hypothetical protein
VSTTADLSFRSSRFAAFMINLTLRLGFAFELRLNFAVQTVKASEKLVFVDISR